MRELFLHVGMHKTGSSAIQRTLFAHRAELAAHGISYLDAAENHSRLVISAVAEAPHRHHGNRRLGLHRMEDARAYAVQAREQVRHFVSTATGPRLVISGEGIGLLPAGEKQRLLALLRPHVDRLTVIGFVRPPRSFIVSALAQEIGGGMPPDAIGQAGSHHPAYRLRFEAFDQAAEVDALRLHPYEDGALLHGCSVASFLHLCGAAPEFYRRLEVARANVGMSDLAARLMLAANLAAPMFLPDGALNPDRAARLRPLLESVPGGRFSPPEAIIAGILTQAADDIAWMEARRGAAFDSAEKLAAATPPGAGLQRMAWDELIPLLQAVNALLLRHEVPRAAAADRTPRTRTPAR